MAARIDRRTFAIGASSLIFAARRAAADPPTPPAAPTVGRDGFIHTGSGTRVKSVAFIDVKVYDIQHFMKVLPATKSREAVVAMHCDKRFTWKTRRDLPADKAREHLRHGFDLNLYTNKEKIERFLTAFGDGDIKEGTRVVIDFDADSDVTSLTVGTNKTEGVEGVDFMKAVWSLWLGRIEQAKLAEQLISKI